MASSSGRPTKDPFYTVKEKVQTSMTRLDGELERVSELTPGSDDAINGANNIKLQIQQITVGVNDLAQTITIVESNRSRFASIDNRELDARKKIVADIKTAIAKFNEKLNNINNNNANSNSNNNNNSVGKSEKGAKNKNNGGGGGDRRQLIGDVGQGRFASSIAKEEKRSNDTMINNASQMQQQIIDEQDIVLEDMSASLARLTNMAQDINTELKVHDTMLQEVDADMDEAKSRFDLALKKMDKLLKSSDKGRLCCIVVLFITCIALLFGIIYG